MGSDLTHLKACLRNSGSQSWEEPRILIPVRGPSSFLPSHAAIRRDLAGSPPPSRLTQDFSRSFSRKLMWDSMVFSPRASTRKKCDHLLQHTQAQTKPNRAQLGSRKALFKHASVPPQQAWFQKPQGCFNSSLPQKRCDPFFGNDPVLGFEQASSHLSSTPRESIQSCRAQASPSCMARVGQCSSTVTNS